MKRILGSVLALSILMSGVAMAGTDGDRRYGHDRYDRDVSYRGHDRNDRDDRRDRDDDDDDRYRRRHDNDRSYGHHMKQQRRPPHYVEYRRGHHLRPEYRGYYVRDYQDRGLHVPPRGYEWRRVDDRYLLVSIASGVIASVIINSL